MKNLPKKLQVNIDGHTVVYTIAGRGRPAIVLINGAGGPLEAWYKLYPDIERLGTVVAYDRPGVGGSSPPLVPQTGEANVRLLRKLLSEIGVTAPYVLVAHSFGGLHANLFARLYPQDIAGVVLLEAAAPEDVGMTKAHQGPLQRALNRVLGVFARRDPNDEVSHERETVTQLSAAPQFPGVPLRVVSGGKAPPTWLSSSEATRRRNEHQELLVGLSPLGRRIVASGSGHFPQMSQPDLVLSVIAEVAEPKS